MEFKQKRQKNLHFLWLLFQDAQDEKEESGSPAGVWHNVLSENRNPTASNDFSSVFQAHANSEPNDEGHQFMFPGGAGGQEQGGFIHPGSFQQGPFMPMMPNGPLTGQPNMPNTPNMPITPLIAQPNMPNQGQPTFPNQLFPQIVGPINQNNRFPIIPVFPRPQPIVVGPQPTFIPPVYPTRSPYVPRPLTYQPPPPTYQPHRPLTSLQDQHTDHHHHHHLLTSLRGQHTDHHPLTNLQGRHTDHHPLTNLQGQLTNLPIQTQIHSYLL